MRGMGALPGSSATPSRGSWMRVSPDRKRRFSSRGGQADADVHGDPPADLLAADVDLHRPILGPRFAPLQARRCDGVPDGRRGCGVGRRRGGAATGATATGSSAGATGRGRGDLRARSDPSPGRRARARASSSSPHGSRSGRLLEQPNDRVWRWRWISRPATSSPASWVQGAGRARVAVAQHEGQRVGGQPEGQVVGAERALEAPRHGLHHGLAALLPAEVVEIAKVVEAHADEGQRLVGGLGCGELGRQEQTQARSACRSRWSGRPPGRWRRPCGAARAAAAAQPRCSRRRQVPARAPRAKTL